MVKISYLKKSRKTPHYKSYKNIIKYLVINFIKIFLKESKTEIDEWSHILCSWIRWFLMEPTDKVLLVLLTLLVSYSNVYYNIKISVQLFQFSNFKFILSLKRRHTYLLFNCEKIGTYCDLLKMTQLE
jgi:hypothetical protein